MADETAQIPTEDEIEQTLRVLPNLLLDRIPLSDVRRDARGSLHEAARLAHIAARETVATE